MTTVEALRTQNDNLQWEINRLDSENRHLRANDEEGNCSVDLEPELEQARKEVSDLTQEIASTRTLCEERVCGSAPGRRSREAS